MFVKAIERAAEFTRAIHTITRVWGSEKIVPGSATLFFVNSDGWALTCAHVAKQFVEGGEIAKKFDAFKEERSQIEPGKRQRNDTNLLERKYGYRPGQVIELHSRLIACVEGSLNLDIIFHKSLDIALLKFSRFNKLLCNSFPVFGRNGDDLKQGLSICRLGFPFPEFTNYGYDSVTDSLGWTEGGQEFTPRFPIDGIVVRHVGSTEGEIIAFEVSTPGIRGQSGGPAFDVEGHVWGMQSITKHLDLEFDIDVEVRRGTTNKRVQDNAFLHVGGCIHVNALKDFMRENGVKFQEG
jgi:hypothetical protein